MSGAHGHRTDIEGLRAIAVGLVLLYHAQLPWFGGGFLGVDVFFVISGFLITSSLVREVERTGHVKLSTFYARRARRLLPAAALVLVSSAVAVRALLPATMWRDFGGDIAAAAAYVINWRLAWRSVDYLAEDVVASPVQHFWSLAIEEQFYFVWPLLLLGAAVVARRRDWPVRTVSLVALLGVVMVPSLVWSVVQTSARPALAFFDLGTRMWELGAGGLLAVLPVRRPVSERVAVTVKVAALVVLVGLGVLLDETVPWPGVTAAAVVVPTALLLRLGGRGVDPVHQLLSLRPMQLAGAWSYSLYLWHWPPLAILAARWDGLTVTEASVVVLLSVPVAVASHHLVENPVRYAARLRDATRRTLQLGGGLSVAGLVAGLAVVAAVPGDGGPTLVLEPDTPVAAGTPAVVDDATGRTIEAVDGPLGAAVLAALDPPPTAEEVRAMLALTSSITPTPTTAVEDLPQVYPDRCHAPMDAFAVTVCEYGDPDGEVHVALVGDSKAGQWGDTLMEVGERHGWRLTYLLKSTCELTTAMPDRDGPDEACAAWGRAVLDMLVDDPPDVVLTSQISGTAWAEDGQDPVLLQVEGMLDAYGRLRDAGSEVVLLLDNINPGMNVYQCVAEHLDDLDACSFPFDRGSPSRPTQLTVAAEGGYEVIDLADQLCPADICPPVIGNVLLYRQGSHVSNTYARTMVDVLDERLRPVVDAVVSR